MLSYLFQKYFKISAQAIDNSIFGVITFSIENTDCLLIYAKFSKRTLIFFNFTIGMIGNETGLLLKCVKLY